MAKRDKQLIRYTGRYALPALLLLCMSPPGTAFAFESATVEKVPAYHLDELAFGLKDASGPVRADLAYAAVAELAAAYARESELARREIQRQPEQRKLQRWAVAVESLASELEQLAQTVTTQSSVQTAIGPGNSLYLIVDGKPVVVSGPRKNDQDALEQRIVYRFCNLHPCEQLVRAPPLMDTAVAASTPAATTLWTFSEATGPVCSSADGLAFQFDNASDLRRKRTACARVVAELRLLANAIRLRHERGTRVDWKTINIVTLPLGLHHEVQLNRDGDVLTMYVPALATAPDLFMLLRPWLAARVNGVDYQVSVINAETLLPPVGFMGQ